MTLAEHCLYKMEHSGPPVCDLKAGRVRGRLVYSDRCFSAGIRNGGVGGGETTRKINIINATSASVCKELNAESARGN
jgi:hypothetical protein